MKKVVVAVVVAVASLMFGSVAQAQAPAKEASNAGNWEVLQGGFWYGIPSSQNFSKACGLRFGLPGCGGEAEVNGVEFAIGTAMSDRVHGFQFAPFFAKSDYLCGLAISVVNLGVDIRGVQIGLVNIAKTNATQIGLINIIEDSPCFLLPIFNIFY